MTRYATPPGGMSRAQLKSAVATMNQQIVRLGPLSHLLAKRDGYVRALAQAEIR